MTSWMRRSVRRTFSARMEARLLNSLTHNSGRVTRRATSLMATSRTRPIALAVAERELPGFGELMRSVSLKYVPTAILSRQVGAIRGRCLILNLPGQPKAIKETLDGVFAAVPYCIDLIGGPYLETNEELIKAFRPKSAQRPK